MEDAIRESILLDDKSTEMYEDRVNDTEGWLIESLTQAKHDWWARLGSHVINGSRSAGDRQTEYDLAVGRMVRERIDAYCTPDEEEIRDALGRSKNCWTRRRWMLGR